jgi:hypothetical protein
LGEHPDPAHRAAPPPALALLACYLFFAGLLAGPAWLVYHNFDPHRFSAGNDVVSYLRLAQGQRPENPVHFYRVAVPIAAGAMARAVALITHRDPATLLRASFMVVNLALTAAAALILFLMLLDYVADPGYAFVGVLCFLLSRDVIDETGLPSIDSLLFLTVAASFYAIRLRNQPMLGVVLLLGPSVKENFAFLLPILFLFGALPTGRFIVLMGVGYLLALGMRGGVDAWLHTAQARNAAAAIAHARRIPASLRYLASPHGAANLLMVFGPFWLILALGFFGGAQARSAWRDGMDRALRWWLPLVLAQMLLSGNLSRMAILAFPVMGAAVALILARHPIAQALIPQRLRRAQA